MGEFEIFEKASPEWVAKRYIIEIYFRVAGLEAAASLDPTLFRQFRAGVGQLYRILRVKMWKHKKQLGLTDEKLKRYDSYLRWGVKLKPSQVIEWFNDVQLALESLGYTRFERSSSVEQLVRESRE